MPLQTVNPGDLITAAEWNDLVAALNGLDARVTELESGGSNTAPRITEVLPTGPRTVGDDIRIYGSNFDFTRGGHSVFFGTTRAITFLGGSSDTLLLVRIPDPVDGASEAGTAMTLTVGNLVDTTTRSITIKSLPVVTHGGVLFSFTGTHPGATPAANAQFFYDFVLTSIASENLTVTITPTIAVIPPLPGGVTDPGLPTLLDVLDSDGTVRPDRQISLLEGATKTISLRLRLPSGVNGLQYSLGAVASAPGIASVAESLPNQQVGLAGETPDPTITGFEFFSIVVGDAIFAPNSTGVGDFDGTFSIRQSTTATVRIRAVFANIPAGTTNNYDISMAIDSPAGGWSAALNANTATPVPVASAGPAPISVDVTAPGTAATTTLRLTLTRRGLATNNRRTVAYRLNLRTP
jgi:hypothetical protein